MDVDYSSRKYLVVVSQVCQNSAVSEEENLAHALKLLSDKCGQQIIFSWAEVLQLLSCFQKDTNKLALWKAVHSRTPTEGLALYLPFILRKFHEESMYLDALRVISHVRRISPTDAATILAACNNGIKQETSKMFVF